VGGCGVSDKAEEGADERGRRRGSANGGGGLGARAPSRALSLAHGALGLCAPILEERTAAAGRCTPPAHPRCRPCGLGALRGRAQLAARAPACVVNKKKEGVGWLPSSLASAGGRLRPGAGWDRDQARAPTGVKRKATRAGGAEEQSARRRRWRRRGAEQRSAASPPSADAARLERAVASVRRAQVLIAYTKGDKGRGGGGVKGRAGSGACVCWYITGTNACFFGRRAQRARASRPPRVEGARLGFFWFCFLFFLQRRPPHPPKSQILHEPEQETTPPTLPPSPSPPP